MSTGNPVSDLPLDSKLPFKYFEINVGWSSLLDLRTYPLNLIRIMPAEGYHALPGF